MTFSRNTETIVIFNEFQICFTKKELELKKDKDSIKATNLKLFYFDKKKEPFINKQHSTHTYTRTINFIQIECMIHEFVELIKAATTLLRIEIVLSV